MNTEAPTAPNFRPPQRPGLQLTAFAAVLVAIVACGGDSPSRRVMLIGIDGASPRIVDQLMAERRLPNLARIARRGVHGTLRSQMPIVSPRIWNTIATGMVPEKHGILDFSYLGRDRQQHLYASTDRRARTLWSIACYAGFKVGVVNFWNTYPLEKVNGVMVSDHVLATEIEKLEELVGVKKTEYGAVIYPDSWNARLSGMIKNKETPLPNFEDPFRKGQMLPHWVKREELQRRFVEDGALARMTLEISLAEAPDLTMVLLTGIDRISHYLWSVVEPPDGYSPHLVPTPEGREAGKAALFAYYEYTDALIGALASSMGPEDLVMVISDHGFEAGESMLHLTGSHFSEKSIDGIIYASGSGISPASIARDVSVQDITPTLLSWLGLPAALDMDGIRAAFLEADSSAASIPPIKSYDFIALEFVNPSHVPSGVEDEIVEQLRALGYIDPEE